MEDEKAAREIQTEPVSNSPPGSDFLPASPRNGEKSDDGEPPDVPFRLLPTGKSLALATSCQSGALSSSDEDEKKEEVEMQVRLEIHSPPTDPPVQLQEDEQEKPQPPPSEFLPDNSKSRTSNPITSPPPPVLSCSISPPSPQTTPPSTIRHWAPPKGFWRVARPETLLLNGMDPQSLASGLPYKDYTQGEDKTEDHGDVVGNSVNDAEASQVDKHDGVCVSLPGGGLSADEKGRQKADEKLKERQQKCREQQYRDGHATDGVDYKADEGACGGFQDSIILQELEPYLRSLLVISDDFPLSPRHEQAKRLLERARLKARANHVKGDRPSRRSHSDHRSTTKKQQVETLNPTLVQKPIQAKEDLTAQRASGPFLVPDQGDAAPPGDHVVRLRRYGCSPTRVRFEDESEREAESRYLDRVRQRGRTAVPKSKNRGSNTDSSSSGSERSRSHRSVSMPGPQKPEIGVNAETMTVIREIIVLVKKCEACGSVVKEPQPGTSLTESQIIELQQGGNPEDTRGRTVPYWVPPNKPDVSARPKAPLTVTFAGAFVLGENKEKSTGWKSSGFGKLRRRSRKGESRLESGNGPYGPSWAQRRNSNPRNRVNLSRVVSFAPDSPVTLEPRLMGAAGGVREAPTLPIKSALKSSSRNRCAAGQSTVQFQMTSNQGGEVGPERLALLDCPEARRESPASSAQGSLAICNPAACIRPSTLRYSPARLNPDMPAADAWDATLEGAVTTDTGAGSEFHPATRSLALSRAEDLRAELLRAEHLKAEAVWEDSSRKLDGRPKLFLRRFFSSIGLNGVGRLVKGGRSSSMEQLSIPTSRSNTTSPSPTRRPHPTIRIQRTPSLQTLHTALPLAQLRKASSVQSLERRTERTTILGEVQIPYGLARSPDSPRLDLHRTLSVEDVIPSRVVRPAGRVSQAFPDGSLLLELIRPPNGPFGFVISRGKGRPDTGVYVEKVGDGTGDVPYVGLLGVGDEIVQVNGEMVAGLSLDQVTRLMTRESIASLRIMPARRSPR